MAMTGPEDPTLEPGATGDEAAPAGAGRLPAWLLPAVLLGVVGLAVYFFVFREGDAERSTRLMAEAERAMRAGDVATAEKHLKDILHTSPRSPVVHHNLGVLYAEHGRLAEARSAFQQAADLTPPEANEARGEELFQLAQISYRERDWTRAAEELERSIAAHPTRSLLHTRLMDLQLGTLRDAAAADSSLARFLRLCGSTPQNLHDAAFVYMRNQAFTASTDLARRAIAASDTLISAHVILGRSLVEAGRGPEALTHLDAQLERWPRSIDLWNARGHVLQVMGAYGRALENADRVLELAPNEYWGHQLRAIALASLGRNEESLEEVKICLASTRDPNEQRRLLKLQGRLNAAMGRAPSVGADSAGAGP
jgi:tetratricopeptide (TPR) repeat protein